MKSYFIEKTYILPSILEIKQKYLRESFVTFTEINQVSEKLQKELNDKNINAIITDGIDKYFFAINDVITINRKNNISLDSLINFCYTALSMETLSIIRNKSLILKSLIEIKKDEIELLKDSNKLVMVKKQ